MLAYLTNRVAFGNMPVPNAPVPLTYDQFQFDSQKLQKNFVFGAPGADAQLEANKQEVTDELRLLEDLLDRVQRPVQQGVFAPFGANQSINKL